MESKSFRGRFFRATITEIQYCFKNFHRVGKKNLRQISSVALNSRRRKNKRESEIIFILFSPWEGESYLWRQPCCAQQKQLIYRGISRGQGLLPSSVPSCISTEIPRWVLTCRCDLACGWDLAVVDTWPIEHLTVNAEVATVLGSIPAFSKTVEIEGQQMKQCWRKYWKNLKNPIF